MFLLFLLSGELNLFILIGGYYFTILYWFCHTSTWIRHGWTRVPHPEPSSLLPPRTIPLGHPSAPAPIILCHALNLDWRFISYMILYMFQCHSPKSSHPLPLLQSPEVRSIHLCLFCCLTFYRNVTLFSTLRVMQIKEKNTSREKSFLVDRHLSRKRAIKMLTGLLGRR